MFEIIGNANQTMIMQAFVSLQVLTLSARPKSFGEPPNPRHIAQTRDDLPLPEVKIFNIIVIIKHISHMVM